MKIKNITRFIIFAVIGIIFVNFFIDNSDTPSNQDEQRSTADLSIVSGSENKALQPIVEAWARKQGVAIEISYQGSVDIYRLLQQGSNTEFDAVWPANHLWIELGDEQKIVKHEKSIMRSPVVLGVKKDIAEQLSWANNANVSIRDILDATDQKRFRLAMTSATQSNSGASAYFGFLYAMANYPDTLTSANLNDPEVQKQVKALLGNVNRSSGSSGWLKEALIQHPDRFDAMFNYEAMLIEANQMLISKGQQPLCAIYPKDGLMVADSPLGLIDKKDQKKEQLFLELQAHLLSKQVQQQIENTGRRTGLLGMDVSNNDKSIWNPDWCIDTQRAIAPIPTPEQRVIQQALNLYQTDLRKPSLTVWVLDVSGSMQGEGISDLRTAMTTLLDNEQAQTHLLQSGKNDITFIIPFSNDVEAIWKVQGNSLTEQTAALQKVNQLQAGGGTDLYLALKTALETLKPYYDDGTLWDYLPAIVAMTDGRSMDKSLPFFEQTKDRLPYAMDIPIHAIAFGQANPEQLKALTEQSVGRFFDSHGDLPKTLRKAKGYN